MSCQRSPEPVYLKWKGVEIVTEGDYFVGGGARTANTEKYVQTRFQ